MWNERYFVVNLRFDLVLRCLCQGCFCMHVTCLANGLTETCSEMFNFRHSNVIMTELLNHGSLHSVSVLNLGVVWFLFLFLWCNYPCVVVASGWYWDDSIWYWWRLWYLISMTDLTDYFCAVMLSGAAGVNLVSLVGCWIRICWFVDFNVFKNFV